jgi:lipopolysaccharide/colanic/teichoic acid biosynthesis glycosyltransferase
LSKTIVEASSMMQNNHLVNVVPTIMPPDQYTLRWKGKYLIVRAVTAGSPSDAWLQDFESDWIVACLRRSPIQVIRLDLNLSEAVLALWVNAAAQAGKQVYVSLPIVANLPQKNRPMGWWLKRVIDYGITALLSVILIPITLCLMAILRPADWRQVLVWDWHVGERGRLFPMFRLRTVDDQGRWLRGGRKIRMLKLDRVAKFLNVLRGEISLVGSCPWRVTDAAQVDMALRYRLHGLPGVTGQWMMQARWKLVDAYFLSQLDLDYLWHWSLLGDLRCLVAMLSRMAVLKRLVVG